MNITGTYAEKEDELEYVCRVFSYGHGRDIKWVNGVDEPIEIKDGDVLMMLGKGTWFALYRETQRDNT